MTVESCSLKNRCVLVGERMAQGLPDVLEQRDLDLMSLADAIDYARQYIGHVLPKEEFQSVLQGNLKDPVGFSVKICSFAGYLWDLTRTIRLSIACSQIHRGTCKAAAISTNVYAFSEMVAILMCQ